MKILQWITINLLLSITLYGQGPNDLKLKMENYGSQKGLQGLYLHTDKTNYITNDNIWFTGYQLSTIQGDENTMFVSLQEPLSGKIVTSGKFVMNKGIASGTLFIDPSTPAGHYRLLAYTNLQFNHTDKSVFQQNMTIIKKQDEAFTLVKQKESDRPDKDGNYQVTYKIIAQQPEADVRKGKIFYYLNDPMEKNRRRSAQVNDFGEFEILLPKNLVHIPVDLNATWVSGNDTEYLQKRIQPQDSLAITFYPEGGSLIVGIKSNVAFSVWSSAGKGANRNFDLYKNNVKIMSLKSDASGIGSFGLTPEQNALYTVKQAGGEMLTAVFPAIKSGGFHLIVPHAVIGDSISGLVLSAGEHGQLQAVLHNYKEVFRTENIDMTGSQANFNINVSDVKPGLAFLTLLNHNGDPVAERAIYIKPKSKTVVRITADSISYHARSKVNLKIKVQDEFGNPVRSLFSIASVLSETYDSTMITPLPSFYYCGQFEPVIKAMPANCFNIPDEKMELFLLTRFWYDHRWNESQRSTYTSAVSNLSEGLAVKIQYKDKPVKKPLPLLLMSDDSTTLLLNTDSAGTLLLPYKMMTTDYGQKIRLMPVPDKQYIHNFSSSTNENVLDSMQSFIAKKNDYIPDVYIVRAREPEPVLTARKGFVLKTVNIVSARKGNGYNGLGRFFSEACNDYVCQYNILNCSNHPYDRNTRPVDGGKYWYVGPNGLQEEVIYQCKAFSDDRFLAKVNGVWKTRNFYAADYDKYSPEELEVYSTAFWSPQVITDEHGEANLSFFTNDLLGSMTIHIQGMSTAGPLTGKAFYKVVK